MHEHIVDKIEGRHGVAVEEAEEACFSAGRHTRRGRHGFLLIYNQIASGEYLFVVLAEKGGGVWSLVTARRMTASERRLYRENRGR